METNQYVFFYGHKPNNINTQYFSQWYQIEFSEDNDGLILNYRNAEQYMMAQKALLFGDGNIFMEIMNSDNPAEMKSLGRKIRNFDEKIWNNHKFDIVVQGNRLKFNQNKQLMDRLLATGNKTIVEASPYDRIWGIGLTATNAVNLPPNKWLGKNLLGKALMVVRSEAQKIE